MPQKPDKTPDKPNRRMAAPKTQKAAPKSPVRARKPAVPAPAKPISDIAPIADIKATRPVPTEALVFDLQGKQVGAVALDPAVWGGPVNTKVLVQAIAMYRSNVRAGTASTKTRGDVSGGGKKPWKQKHTGRARAGSTRSPLWRGGGKAFGPHPRDFSYRLPQQIRRRALLEGLKGKLRDEELVVLDHLEASEPKTKPFGALAKTFEVKRRSVIVLDQPNEATVKSLRNLADFELAQAGNLNAFDILNAHKVLVTKSAFARLQARFAVESPSHAASN